MGLHQTKKLLHGMAKDTINRKKRHPTVWKNIFVNDISDKGLTFNIYKELTCLNAQKTNNLIKNGQSIWKDTSPKKKFRWSTGT